MLTGRRGEVPPRDRVVSRRHRGGLGVVHLRVEDLAAHTGVADEVDRAVRGPGGPIRFVRPVLEQHPVRAPGGGNHEHVAVVVGLEVGAGRRNEQNLGTVRRELGAALTHRVVGQPEGVPAVSVHDPDLTLVPVVEEGRKGSGVRNALPVGREPELQDREVAPGDPFGVARAVARSRDPEQVPLLVVLIEGEEIVPEVVLPLFLRGLGVRRDEVDVLSVRRKGVGLHRAFVLCEGRGFPSPVRHPMDLLERTLSPAGQKGHPRPVRRPARARLPVFAVRQPDIAAAVGTDPVDVGGPAVLLPVGVGARVEQLGPVRGQSRTPYRGNVDQFDDGHGTLFLRPTTRSEGSECEQDRGSAEASETGLRHEAPPPADSLRRLPVVTSCGGPSIRAVVTTGRAPPGTAGVPSSTGLLRGGPGQGLSSSVVAAMSSSSSPGAVSHSYSMP